MAFCGMCGAPLDEGAQFCGACGATTIPEGATSKPPESRVAPTPPAPTVYAPPIASSRSRHTGGLIAGIVAIVAVLLIGGVVLLTSSGVFSSSGGVFQSSFDIQGNWTVTGGPGYGQAQQGAIISFSDDGHCNLYSPYDTYSFSKSGSNYQLSVTGVLGGNDSFDVIVSGNDTIDLRQGGQTVVTMQRTSGGDSGWSDGLQSY